MFTSRLSPNVDTKSKRCLTACTTRNVSIPEPREKEREREREREKRDLKNERKKKRKPRREKERSGKNSRSEVSRDSLGQVKAS